MLENEALLRALPVLRTLERHGFEAVFVGGCVRDTAMGRPLKDVDIATSAEPEQVIAAFAKTIPTGLKHGTVTVLHEGETYEVTTYRTESAYERFRRPAQVRFVTDLQSDLQRRDFTINAMAMRADGAIVDPLGGLADLRRGMLRCVGDADARFQEDALRMVRAIRFAAEFDMRISLATWRAIRRHCLLLGHIAMERIGVELDKMVGGAHPGRAAAWLNASGLPACTKQPLPPGFVHAGGGISRKRRGPEREERLPASGAQAGLTATADYLRRGLAALTSLDHKDDRWAAAALLLRLSAAESAQLFAALKFSGERVSRLSAIVRVQTAMLASFRRYYQSVSDAEPGVDQAGALHRSWIDAILHEGGSICGAWLRVTGSVEPLLEANFNPATDKLVADHGQETRTAVAAQDDEGALPGLQINLRADKAEPASQKYRKDEALLILADLEARLISLPASTVKELAIRGSDVRW